MANTFIDTARILVGDPHAEVRARRAQREAAAEKRIAEVKAIADRDVRATANLDLPWPLSDVTFSVHM